MMQPKHTHDCTSCKFLGRHEPTNADLYYHPGAPGGETIIARYGSEGSNYTSGWRRLITSIRIPAEPCTSTTTKATEP